MTDKNNNRDQGANRNMERQEKPGATLDHERQRQEGHPGQSSVKAPKDQQSPIEKGED